MSKHLYRDMENLQQEILAMSAIVEEMIDRAMRALTTRDAALARTVIGTDGEVDRQEVLIEEDCLKLLALHQPVAVDLRRIATVLKINNDLERIADLAANIAERAEALAAYPDFPIPGSLEKMAEKGMAMVRRAMDSFVNSDTQEARDICASDEEVDQLNSELIDELYRQMQKEPAKIAPAMHCFSASRHIERIADHATNIAEDVIYMVEGEIVRHQHRTPPKRFTA